LLPSDSRGNDTGILISVNALHKIQG